MTAVDFTAFPRTVTTGGSFRFFPVVTDAPAPVLSYNWYYRNTGTATWFGFSTEATPILTPAAANTFDVRLTVYFTDGSNAYLDKTAYITTAAAASVPDIPTDGTYEKVSAFIYDDTYSMMVNRTPTAICKLYLLNPKITNVLDKSPTTTFQILDIGDSTATEKLLIAEGKYVMIIQGKDIPFSGIIRRCTQDTQMGFAGTTQVKLWNIECDSDLMRLAKTNVYRSAEYLSLLANGKPIEDTPGNIARLILAPAPGAADWRGNICCNDTKVTYQITSTSALVEEVASQYDHITTLRDISNYDLITRMDFSAYTYTSFNGANAITMSGRIPAYIAAGSWIFFTTNHLPGTPETTNTQGCLAYGKYSAGSPTTIVLSPIYGAVSVPLTPDTFICAKSPLVDFATDLSTPSALVTLNVNQNFYDYTDNDDKRKLATKIIAKAKDINGKSISVSLAACHAYDEDRQFFNDCTFISKRSEGYVYKNTFLEGLQAVTFRAAYETYPTHPFSYSIGSANLVFAGNWDFQVNDPVNFFTDGSATPVPPPLATNNWYFIKSVSHSGGGLPPTTTITVSSTQGGAAIIIIVNGIGDPFMQCVGCAILTDNTSGSYEGGSVIRFKTVSGILPTSVPTGTTFYPATLPPKTTNAKFAIGTTPGGSPYYGSVRVSDVGTAPMTIYIYDPSYPTSKIWLYGWGYCMPVGMAIMLATPGSTPYTTTVVASPTTEHTDGSGVKYTEVLPGDWFDRDYGGSGYLFSDKLWVNKAIDVYSAPATLLFGEEPIPITSTATDATYGDCLICNPILRIPSNTLKAYPHDIGCLVAKNNYTETAPETGSPLQLYGLSSNAPVVDANTTYGQLDAYVTSLLLGFGAFYKKASGWLVLTTTGVKRVGQSAVQPSLTTPPRVGDSVAVVEYSGATAQNYEIVSVTIKYDEGVISLELGDYEKNVFTSLQQSTNAINKTLT